MGKVGYVPQIVGEDPLRAYLKLDEEEGIRRFDLRSRGCNCLVCRGELP
jgi:hypothetical protein